MIEPAQHHFAPDFTHDGRFPNSRLPLLAYAGAIPTDPALIEQCFAQNNWSNSWRNGVFTYHHFHSIAHEALGIAAGSVRVLFGGPGGYEITLNAGDAVVIPAGVAHCNMGQSANLLVIGAYPNGGTYDVLRGNPSEYERASQAAATVPPPQTDPVIGTQGGAARLWQNRHNP